MSTGSDIPGMADETDGGEGGVVVVDKVDDVVKEFLGKAVHERGREPSNCLALLIY